MEATRIQVWLAISPVVILLITQIFNYLDKRATVRKPQQHNKLEDQYQKVLAPLHRLLRFGGDDISEKREAIEKVLTDNYFLVPQPIIESWGQDDYQQFKQHIDNSFQVAANRLGYAQIKLKVSKQEHKQIQETLATPKNGIWKSFFAGFTAILAILSIIAIITFLGGHIN